MRQMADFFRSRQFWLLGYEFPTTMMLLTVDSIYILTTAKKGEDALHRTYALATSYD